MGDPNFYEQVGTRLRPARSDDRVTEGYGVPATTAPKAPPHTDMASGCSRWAARGDMYHGVGETYAELPPGLYRCIPTDIGPALMKQKVETDNLLELPDDAGRAIINEFATFWKIGSKFRERGFLHKRGFMLWGPPGSGKTSCVQLLVKRLIEEQKGVVLFLDHPGIAASCLQIARKIEPHRPMIAIMEDLDALVRKFGENEYLALLDGEAQVDNIVFLASTNYPELLDKRFVDRPSRFDTIRYIGMPSAEARRVYLQAKEPSLQGDELEDWVKASEGFSVAHLKELIVAVKCFDQSLETVVKRLEEMQARKPTSEDSPERVGMGFIGLRNGHANGLGHGHSH